MVTAVGRSAVQSPGPRDRMGILTQSRRRKHLGGMLLFMLAALTPLLIDLYSEWSVNTAEQT